MECCCEQLRRDHHRNYPGKQANATETTCLAEIKQIAVRAKNRAVNRAKLNTLRQDKGEPIRKFAGRIRSLASVSGYSLPCSSCKTAIYYTDEIIMDQVIAGIADLEIQKDVLSHPDASDLCLEKLLVFIEGKESGQTSLGLISCGTVAASSNVIEKPKDRKCRYCGDVHELGKKNCKAAGTECSKCGRKDHFSKVRRSSKKNEVGNAVKSEKVAVEANWACGVNIALDPEIQNSDATYQFYENKKSDSYTSSFSSDNSLKEVFNHLKKRGVTPWTIKKRQN